MLGRSPRSHVARRPRIQPKSARRGHAPFDYCCARSRRPFKSGKPPDQEPTAKRISLNIMPDQDHADRSVASHQSSAAFLPSLPSISRPFRLMCRSESSPARPPDIQLCRRRCRSPSYWSNLAADQTTRVPAVLPVRRRAWRGPLWPTVLPAPPASAARRAGDRAPRIDPHMPHTARRTRSYAALYVQCRQSSNGSPGIAIAASWRP